MNGYSAKEKLAALLLTSSFVASPIANLGIVGSADEVPSTQVNSNTGGIETKDIPDVSVLESTINVSGDYSIKKADAGNIAYIGYGKKITLSASGSDWATLSKIELLDSDRNVCGEFSADSEDVDIQKSGTYSLKLYGVNGSTYEESLVDKVGFEKVSYDAVGVSISNVRLGYNGNALSDGSWVITSSLDDIYFNVDSSYDIDRVVVNLNGTNVTAVRSIDNSYIVSKSSIEGIFKRYESVVIDISAVNDHESRGNSHFSVNVENLTDAGLSDVSITDKDGNAYSPYYDLNGSDVYLKRNSGITFSVENGISGIAKVLLYKNGDAHNVSEYIVGGATSERSKIKFNTVFDEGESYYTVIKYNSDLSLGEDGSLKLLGGRVVKYDEEAPVIESALFNDSNISNDWYSSNGVLKFTVSENVAFGDEFTFTVNDTDLSSKVVHTVADGKHIFQIDSAEFSNSPSGSYSATLKVSDMLGNTSSKTVNLLIDTDTPICVDGDNKATVSFSDDNVIEVAGRDLILVSGDIGIFDGSKFLDTTSGVSEVKYYRNSYNKSAGRFVERYSSYFQSGILNIDGASPDDILADGSLMVDLDGIFVVTDKAGNVSEFTVKELLKRYKSLGDETVELDVTSPVIRYKGSTVEEKNGYYLDNPIFTFEVTDDHLSKVSAKVNGEISDYDISSDNEYILDLPDEDGVYSIEIIAVDDAGHTSSYPMTAVVDTNDPYLDVAYDVSPVSKHGDIYYFDASLSLTASAYDISNIKGYCLLKGNTVIDRNSTGRFTISDDGEYYIEVEDGSGRVTKKSLQDIFGIDTNKVAFDLDAPELLGDVKSSTIYDNWYSDNVDIDISASDNVGIDSFSVTVNGKKVDTEGYNVSISTKDYTPDKEGYFVVIAEVTDFVGRTTRWVKTVRVDSSKPEFTGILIETPKRYGSTGYYSDSPVVLDLKGKDSGSGIKGFYLINKTTNSESYSTDGHFEIIDGGSYEVIIEDLVGHKVSKTIGELAGWDFNEIAFDTQKPVVECHRLLESVYNDWYLNDQSFAIKASDNIGIRSVVVTINGVEVDSVHNNGDLVTSYEKNISTANIDPNIDGSYVIRVVVSDVVYDEVEWRDTIYIDRSAPEISSVKIPSPVVIDDGKAYFDGSSFDISITAKDNGSGVKRYYLVSDDDAKESSTGIFNINKNGKYRVEVEDNLGQRTSVPLGDLGKWGVNEVVFDKENPVVEGGRKSSGVYNDDWYDNDVEYSFKASDDVKLKSFKAYVNGSVIECNDFSNPQISFSTKDITPDSNGRVSLKVVAVDMVGKSFTWSDTVYIDKDAPDLKLLSAPKVDSIVNGTAFFNKGSIEVSVVASDNVSGIKSYRLLKNGQVVASNKDGKFAISGGGSYSIEVIDNVGRSTVKSLNDLVKWGTNNIDFDTVTPTIVGTRSASSNYENWYSSDIDFSISAKDNMGISSVRIYINSELVSTFTPEDIVKSKDFTISTKGINAASDGSYSVRAIITDVVGLESDWSDMIRIDRSDPRIEGFVLSGGITTLSGKYKYVFDGNGTAQINVSDRSPSSGIKSVYVKIGNEWTQYDTNGDSVVYVDIPANYKGNISAYAVDNMGRRSAEVMSDGLVSEDSNTAFNHSSIKINFDNTDRYDGNNNPIFRGDITGVVNVSCDWAGLKELKWGIGNNTLGEITDFRGASSWDENIPLSFSTSSVVSSEGRSQEFWVHVIDNAGYESSASRLFSIDKTSPALSVVYDKTEESGYYSSTRSAKVTVSDANIDLSSIELSGEIGEMSSWVRSGDSYTSTIKFSEDGVYGFSITAYDTAGNSSSTHSSGDFVVDKSRPTLHVNWDSSLDSGYYSSNRVATIQVVDSNFDPSLMEIRGGKLGQWFSNGNVHTASVEFSSSGSLYVAGRDLAGNAFASTYESEMFVIDKSAPTIEVTGISDGVSYKDNVGLFVDISDGNIDVGSTKVYLTGRNHARRELPARIVSGGLAYSFEDFPKTEDTDDRYTLSIYAVDRAGNSSSKSVEFSVNRFGSSYDTVIASSTGSGSRKGASSTQNKGTGNSDGTGNSSYRQKSETVKVTEVNVDAIDIDKVRVVVTKDGKEIEVPADKVKITQTEKEGKMVVDYEIDDSVFTEDGKYTVQIYSATDDGTENSSVAEEYSFIKDSTAPEVIISGIEDGGRYQESTKKVTIDVRDLSGVESIVIKLNGKQLEYTEVSGLYVIEIPESEGEQKLSVMVVDKAGNENLVEVNGFVVQSSLVSDSKKSNLLRNILIGFGALVAVLVGVIVARRRKVRRDELASVNDSKNFYSSSKSSGGVSDGMDTSSATDVIDPEEAKTSMFMSDEEGYQTEVMSETGFQTELMDDSESKTDLME